MKKLMMVLGMVAVLVQPAMAFAPSGWVYSDYPWAYDSGSGDWYWFSTDDTQWIANMGSGQWATLPNSALASGWCYYDGAFVYAQGNSAWHWINDADTQWVVNMRTGEWSRLGEVTGTADDYLVIDLSGGPDAASYPVTYLGDVPTGGWTDEYKTDKLVLRKIPAGTFTMGSPTDELGREPWLSDSETQRQVTLTKDFYIGVFEVTQKQWERVMGNWPSYFNNTSCRDSRPVELVSYYEIRENPLPVIVEYEQGSAISPNWPQSSQSHVDSFVGKLRSKTGLTTLDLPTEAQWEYACRAGTGTALNSGKNLTDAEECPNMDELGRYWYNGGSGYTPGGDTSVGSAKVGSYLPNAWGLYDMHGNVWEWCLDWYETCHAATTDPVGAASGSSRVVRGGAWFFVGAVECRSAHRSILGPVSRYGDYGFRLSRTLP